MRVGLPCPVGNSGSNYHGPMCCRTVSLWIIHGLCSSLTQEHWRQQWIMFTLICALKHLWTWLAVKKLTNGNKRQKQWRMGRALRVCLIVCGSKWISDCMLHVTQPCEKGSIFFLSQTPPSEFEASSTHSSCWPAVIKVMQTEKCAALWTWTHGGNQDVKNGMGIGFTAWALQLLHYAGHHRGNQRYLRMTSEIAVQFCHVLLTIFKYLV